MTKLFIMFGALEDPASRWLVVSVPQRTAVGEATLQVWTPSGEPVLLDAHNAAVVLPNWQDVHSPSGDNTR